MPLVLVGLGPPLFLLLGAVVTIGMHRSSSAWLATLIESLTHPHSFFARVLRRTPFAVLLSGSVWMFRRVDTALSRWAVAHEPTLEGWLHGAEQVVLHSRTSVVDFAEATAGALERLTTHTIPRSISAETKPLRRDVKRLGLGIAAAAAALARYRHGIDRLIREHVLPGLRATERAVTRTLPREIGRVRGDVRVIEREIGNVLHGRLSKTARKALGLALAGTVLGVLFRQLPWLRCRNVGRAARNLCGMNRQWLDFLLTGVLDVLLITHLCEFAAVVERASPVVLPVARELVAVSGVVCTHGGATLPGGLTDEERASMGF